MTLSNGLSSVESDFVVEKRIADKFEWRTLFELDPKDRLLSFGLKIFEANKGINASQ